MSDLLLIVEPIPTDARPVVAGVTIGWRWTLTKPDRPNDPEATFTSGCPTKLDALRHARELAATHGYRPDQIEERIIARKDLT